MSTFSSILTDFEKFDLIELDAFTWMNRKDTKYIFSRSLLPKLLQKLSLDYKVLMSGNNCCLPYETVYYDTANFDMYLHHHNGRATRLKIRQRTYLSSNNHFLEIKSGNNKGRTIKERISKTAQNNWSEAENEFIKKRTQYAPEKLFPSVVIKYLRITLLNKILSEKITIDIDLEFSNTQSSHKINNLVIMEIKQVSAQGSTAVSALKELKIRSQSMSKYCLGINYLYPHLKRNNFKQKLVTLNKIINDTAYVTANIR